METIHTVGRRTAITVGKPDPPTDLTAQHGQLPSEGCILCCKDLNGKAKIARAKNCSGIIAR